MIYYSIVCDKCGEILDIEANNLKEAEEKASLIDCCDKDSKWANNIIKS